MDDTYNKPNPVDEFRGGRKDTSFASEAMAEPTEQTRMVT